MPRPQSAVIAALLVTYAAFYLCRANVDAALPFLVREGYGDKTRLGILASSATLAYAIGKVVMGAAGDRLGGRPLMLLAIAGSVVCSVVFGLSHLFAVFLVLAAANRFFQAGGWPALVQVVAVRFGPARHGLVMGVLSTSYELGNVCALMLSGLIAGIGGWRALFVVNPIVFAVLGGAAALSLPRAGRPRPVGAPDPSSPAAALVAVDDDTSLGRPGPDQPRDAAGPILPALFASGAFWTTVALSALLTFIRIGFLTWTPTFLADMAHATGKAEVSAAIVKSAVFPAAGVIAALSVGPLSDRLGPGRRAPVIAFSLAVVVALTLTLAHAGADHPAPLIFGIGLFLLGPYSLLAGALALDIGGPHGSATAAGIIDGAGYLGATAAPVLLGYFADRAGWSAAFDLVAAAAVLATVIAAAWSVVVARRQGAVLAS